MGHYAKKLWIEVTQDEYELPKFIGDSATDLSMITGIDRNIIILSEKKWRDGKATIPHFVSVELTEKEYLEIVGGKRPYYGERS